MYKVTNCKRADGICISSQIFASFFNLLYIFFLLIFQLFSYGPSHFLFFSKEYGPSYFLFFSKHHLSFMHYYKKYYDTMIGLPFKSKLRNASHLNVVAEIYVTIPDKQSVLQI